MEDLTLSECATLAGIIRAPNNYSPLRHPEAALDRRNVVLKRMLDLGMIPAWNMKRREGNPCGLPPPTCPGKLAPHFVDYVKQQLQDLYDEKVLESEGLTIYTALHPEMAVAADAALKEELALLEKESVRLTRVRLSRQELFRASSSRFSRKPGTCWLWLAGEIMRQAALIEPSSAYRQPGSAIMPFVYLSALDQFTPVSWLKDEPTDRIRSMCTGPKEPMTNLMVQSCFGMPCERSCNAATVNLAVAVGLEKIITILHNLGIQSPLPALPHWLWGTSK